MDFQETSRVIQGATFGNYKEQAPPQTYLKNFQKYLYLCYYLVGTDIGNLTNANSFRLTNSRY